MLCLRGLIVLLISTTLFGCAESTLIRTDPANARVSINNRLVGLSPIVYEVSRNEWPHDNTFHYRIEKEGYLTREGEFKGFVGGGRVTGAVFSLGVSLLFKQVRTLNGHYDFQLEPVAPRVAYEGNATTEERLRHLQDLLDQGLITEEEYTRYRSDILQRLVK